MLACCVNGSGMGLMMKMAVKKAVTALDLKVEIIDYCMIEKGKEKAKDYDMIICPIYFTDSFSDAEEKGVKVVGLNNLVSQNEIQQKLKQILHNA